MINEIGIGGKPLKSTIRHKDFFVAVTKKLAVNGTGYRVLIINFKSLFLTIHVRVEVENTNHRHSNTHAAQTFAGE
jgi:hypothetical protein